MHNLHSTIPLTLQITLLANLTSSSSEDNLEADPDYVSCQKVEDCDEVEYLKIKSTMQLNDNMKKGDKKMIKYEKRGFH
jgi:hypothetical protein